MTQLPELDQLLAGIVTETGGDEPLDHLRAAADVRDRLEDLAEAVLDHFVEEARQAGCSWSEIGTALGVSKQAAQQRHATPGSAARRLLGWLSALRPAGEGFQRFSSEARQAVVMAQEEARALQHASIGAEHILLGLLRETDGVAARALATLGLTVDEARTTLAGISGRGEADSPSHIPFTPGAKKALELSLRESIALGDDHIGTEHVLLGVLEAHDEPATKVLAEHRIDAAAARQAVLDLLRGEG